MSPLQQSRRMLLPAWPALAACLASTHAASAILIRARMAMPLAVGTRHVTTRHVHNSHIFCMKAETRAIEVERKFVALVLKQGGELLGEKQFSDAYFDSEDCVLARQDVWLRRRDSAWELKVPVGDAAHRSGGERSVFREIEGAEAVARELLALHANGYLPHREVGPASLSADLDFEQLMSAMRLQPFAEFQTVRSRLRLGRCGLDVDNASFGHAVLELEIMCQEAEEVPEAEAEIERVAQRLGLQPLGAYGGKLETYIRKYCPNVLARLVDARILEP